MTAFSDVEEFVRLANRTTRFEDLQALLCDVVETLGFDHVALVHHVSTVSTEAIQFATYPEAWRMLARSRDYFADDPVLTACQSSAAGFLWSDLPEMIVLTDRQRGILEAAAACGVGEGFTVPINVPGEFLGSCSFATRVGREVPRRALPAAQYVGCFAFEAARRIRALEAARGSPGRVQLTSRQLDCVVLAAQGKSDWHIAQLLGISSDTVHQHIETAKRRYGVASRTQLVVRALLDSHITFADVVK